MAAARFTEEQKLEILSKLKINLYGQIRECKTQTSNIGFLIKLAAMEKALKYPETQVGGDTVNKLNTYQRMLNEVNQFLDLIKEAKLTVKSQLAA